MLREEIIDNVEHNGHVEAAAALARVLGAALAPALQPLAASQPGTVHCAWLLAAACCVLSLACSSSLLTAYAWYVVIMGMLQLQLCLVQAQAAILVSTGDAAPLFGVLTLGSITMQTLGQVALAPLCFGRCGCRTTAFSFSCFSSPSFPPLRGLCRVSKESDGCVQTSVLALWCCFRRLLHSSAVQEIFCSTSAPDLAY
jgi:hypothetical protein